MSALSLRPIIDAIEEIKQAFCFNDPYRASLTGANALRWKRGFSPAPWPENAIKADEVLNAAPKTLRRVFADAAGQAPDSRLTDLHLEAYRLVNFDPPMENDGDGVEGEFVGRADALIDALEIHELQLKASLSKTPPQNPKPKRTKRDMASDQRAGWNFYLANEKTPEKVTYRAMAKAVGCSVGHVPKLTAWQQHSHQNKKADNVMLLEMVAAAHERSASIQRRRANPRRSHKIGKNL